MGDVLGEVLVQAVGIAFSPIPIIATILMLLSASGTTRVLALTIGWTLAIAGVTAGASAFASVLPDNDPDASRPIQGTIQLLVAVLFFVLSSRQWRNRRRGDEDPPMPKWMATIDAMSVWAAFGLGVLLVIPNPKNTVLTMTAGMSIGGTGLTVAQEIVVLVVFTVVAASSVLIPALGFLLSGDRLRDPLDALRTWLVRNGNTVMAVGLFVLGVSMVSDGVASLT